MIRFNRFRTQGVHSYVCFERSEEGMKFYMRKFAIIGDIHSNMFAFNKILDELEKNEIKEYIFLGDYVLDGFDSNAVLEKIRTLSENVVYGNKEEDVLSLNGEKLETWRTLDRWKNVIYVYDRISQQNFEYIKCLEKYKILDIYGKKIMFFHGSPFKTRDYILENEYEIFDNIIDEYDCDVYLMGHTHLHFYKEYKDKIFINPGSAGMPISDGKKFMYGILTVDENNVKYEQKEIEYNYEDIKKYFLSGNYHKNVKVWAELSLCNLRYGKDYTKNFIKYLKEESNKKNIEFTAETPNWLWNESYKKFKLLHPEIEDL